MTLGKVLVPLLYCGVCKSSPRQTTSFLRDVAFEFNPEAQRINHLPQYTIAKWHISITAKNAYILSTLIYTAIISDIISLFVAQ